MEYKVEMVRWGDEPEARLSQLAARLNEFAKDGWRVVSVDLMAHAAIGTKALPVLLEREAKPSMAMG
jgi:hypothetical protein